MAAMYKVKQLSRITKIPPTSVRGWGRQLEGLLSDQANPPVGGTRLYSDDDLVVFHTAKVLRDEGYDWPATLKALESGERILPNPKSPPESDRVPDSALITADYLEQFTKPLRDHVATLEAQLKLSQAQTVDAQGQLDSEREARLASEIKSARASGQLQVLYRRHWYQFWRVEKPQPEE